MPGYDAEGKPKPFYYACGWFVRPIGTGGKLNAWHGGFIPASEALMVRRHDGICWAVLFNSSSTPEGKALSPVIDPLLNEAIGKL